MKKVIIAFDGTHFSEGAFEFALRLHYLQPLMLTGVFMPQLSFSSLWSYSGGINVPELIPYAEPEETYAIQQNIDRFEELCIKNNIQHAIHKDYFDFALPELKKETRFADLLILSSETFYDHVFGENASEYLTEALHVTECPVVIVPESFRFPEKVLLAYDGSESSVYSIRQFVYLLPELCDLETQVFCVQNEKPENLPDEAYIKEFIALHFKNYNLFALNLSNKKQLNAWLKDKNAILVSGSYGRNFFSQLFRESFINGVVKERKYPVFIAHK